MPERAYSGGVLDPWALLDLSRLRQARGDEVLVGLIGAFSREADERVAGLRRAAADGDMTGAGELAHGLRGSSLAVAAAEAAQCCAEIESAAGRGDSHSVLRLTARLRLHLDDALAALERLFGGGNSDHGADAR